MLHRRRVDGLGAASGLGGEALHEVVDERRNVLAPLTQSGHVERDHGQAEVEVLAEAPGRQLVSFQVFVRRCQHPDVDIDRIAAAHPLEPLLFEYPQDLGLRGERHVRDLVEEQGAPVGLFEASAAAAGCPGEGALDVAEEFALDQFLGDRGAVHLDECAAAAAREAVHAAGDELLAGPVFAGDQDTALGSGGKLQVAAQSAHRLGIADQVPFRFEPVGEFLHFPLEAVALERVLHRDHHPVQRQGLLQEVVGADPHRLDRRVDVAVAGDHDDRCREVSITEFREHVQAVAVGQPHVEQDEIELVARHQGAPADPVRGGGDRVTLVLEDPPQRLPDAGLVVDDQNAGLARHGLAAGPEATAAARSRTSCRAVGCPRPGSSRCGR